MITKLIVSILTALLAVVGIKAFLREKKHKRKQLRVADACDRLIRQFKLAIEYSEFLCCRYIGLDRKNKKLILIDHCGGEIQEHCVSLNEIGESRIIFRRDELHNTKMILLELWSKRNDKRIHFCFYNRDFDPVVELPFLSRKAVHWKTKVDIHKHSGSVSFEAEYVL